jgi:phosphate/sulfate permease
MSGGADLAGILQLLAAPPLVLVLIGVAVAFDFINGFHDAANAIATVVSTRVLTPRLAVYWAATFNFLAVFVFGTAVAHTMGHGIIALAVMDSWVILAALLGAISWNLLTWYYGLPSSSSHALVGGLIGAGFAAETAGAITLALNSLARIPASTTHVIIGAIVGVGATTSRGIRIYVRQYDREGDFYPKGSCWIPGSWSWRCRATRFLSSSRRKSSYFSRALKMT